MGPVDVFFSNAGLSRKGQETASDADWDVSWRVHVMSHVFAARALVPGMLARGSGYLLNTASAAGLLASLNSMPYGVTKNAAVALAEHLAIQYGDRGIRVSVLCPQSVQTGMTTPGPSAARVDGVLQPARGGADGDRGDGGRALPRFSRTRRCRNTCSARPPTASAGCPACAACATETLRRRVGGVIVIAEERGGANPFIRERDGCPRRIDAFAARQRVGAAARGRELEAGERLGLLHRGGHAVDHRHAELHATARGPGRPCRRSRARWHRRPSPARARFRACSFSRARARLFQIEHRDIAGGDRGPIGKAVAADQLLQRHDRARQRGDDPRCALASWPAVTSAASQMPTTG